MAKAKAKPATKAVVKEVKEIKEELPEIVTMGMYRDSTGWRFIELTTKGDKIINREESDHGTKKSFAIDEVKIKMVKRWVRDGQ